MRTDANSLGASIARRLSGESPLPKPTAQMSLAYGRHRGPAPLGIRRAAVVAALYLSSEGQWTLPLTLRPRSLQHHGGQISLPGGRIESGEDPSQAALREFHEELGLPADVLWNCGELSPQYVYGSNNLVRPIVAIIRNPTQNWRPDPVEVEEVIELPLGVLSDPQHRVAPLREFPIRRGEKPIGTLALETPAFHFENHYIWGATALILDQLAQILQSTD